MHIHILGICGTFMGSLAIIAKQLGHTVSGSDLNVYPPMSTQLEMAGIELMSGYSIDHIFPQPDQIIVGNVCLLYTSPSPRDATLSRMPSSA